MSTYNDEIRRLTLEKLYSQSTGPFTYPALTSKMIYASKQLVTYDNLLTIWEKIMLEYNKDRAEVEAYKASKQKTVQYMIPEGSVVEYMENNVFPIVFSALTTTIIEAMTHNCLQNPKSTFDGLDMIAQLLWNNNPRYTDRATENLSIHDMPWAQDVLKAKPRPYFPKSWVYSDDIAATKIQACYRGYLVRKQPNVQDLRQFWYNIKANPIIRHSQESDNMNRTISKVLSAYHKSIAK